MRAFNVLLALAVSLLVALLVFEGGLRLLGQGPSVTLNEFHPTLGWAKRKSTTTRRKSPAGEYDVTFEVNALGMRDDPMASTEKPAGRLRVLALGDSFTLGYTVERDDLFVDQLERWWQEEGRDVEVLNAGTEGYSTDQSALYLAEAGAELQPDLVLYFAYENDIYWNGQTSYTGKDKPRYDNTGELDHAGPFPEPPPPGLEKSLALANLWHKFTSPRPTDLYFTPDGGSRPILREFSVVLPAPPGFTSDAVLRTGGALRAMQSAANALGAQLVVVTIPSHSAVDDVYAAKFGRGALGLEPEAWLPHLPVDTLSELSGALGLPVIDPTPALREATASGQDQYFAVDWHLNPAGNRTLAREVHRELDALGVFAPAHLAQREADLPPASAATGGGLPTPAWVFLALFVALTALHYATYRDLPRWRAPLEVGGMLAAVFAIVLGLLAVLAALPPLYGLLLKVTFVTGVLMFVAYKLGRRLGTIAELLRAFTLRGHWYLMPLVMVLLSIGSLLVVAASSPLVAPFIYTLF